ncbi:MAG: TIGR03943 family protein [Firmicutes bacterium]|nr:TIGR03943 family protein [Bacillota bacterium]
MLKTFIPFAYGLAIVYLETTGKMPRYINPEAGRLNIGAAVFLFVLGLSASRSGTTINTGIGGRIGYLILFLPVLLVLLFPAKEFGASLIPGKGIKVIGFSLKENTKTEAVLTPGRYGQPDALSGGSDIVLDEKNFLSLTGEMELTPGSFIGRQVVMEGFACYPIKTEPDLLVPARYVFNHCAADAGAVGLAVDLNGLPPPLQDTWVRVEGIITLRGESLLIQARSLKEKPKPENGYIYP